MGLQLTARSKVYGMARPGSPGQGELSPLNFINRVSW